MKAKNKQLLLSIVPLLLFAAGSAQAAVNVQCPGDTNGNAQQDDGETIADNVVCKHLVAGDGFATMSDGNPLYTFGFGEQTGTLPENVIAEGILDAQWPGPTIELEEGNEFFLSLTNVGTVIRPDLFDPHTVHFHGFPNASAVFDGVPEVSISVNMGATLTYYYNIVEPGTYIYHCHVEATEHMEMGMLANLFVHPGQDVTGCPSGDCPAATRKGGTDPDAPMGYTYNDDDGSTGFDVEKALQVSSMDSEFHDASLFVQPLPFALLDATYPMINGRGYPDTVLTGDMPAPIDTPDGKVTGDPGSAANPLNNGTPSQKIDSAVTVATNSKLLLRLSNVSIDRFYTLTAQGLSMKVVGTGARQMRGIDGKNLYKDVASINFGGGETHDVIIDTTGVLPGTYFLYSTELHQLSNLTQSDGGMMTEIVVTP